MINFQKIILQSPVLTQGVKNVLCVNEGMLDEREKEKVVNAILLYEEKLLEASTSFLERRKGAV